MISNEETYRRILKKHFPDFTPEEVEELVRYWRIQYEKYKKEQDEEEARAYDEWWRDDD